MLNEQAPWRGSSPRKPRALLLGSGDRENVIPEAERLKPLIDPLVEIVLADFKFETALNEVDADMAIVLGGDGSILRAVKQMGKNQRPVLGINLGKLGFLASTNPNDVEATLQAIHDGQCRIVDHLRFQASIERHDRVVHQVIGLNELAILGGPPYSILDVELYVNGEHATTYSCDGLIISTPVGSTAHSLSAGGPILRKNLDAFVISAISPHTLTVRPVVDSADHTYEIRVQRPNEATSVVVDGRVIDRFLPSDVVRIERAESNFQMIEVKGQTYYRTLREKLNWGARLTDAPE